MEKTLYVVSYTSYYQEICNNVIVFETKEDAIQSANSYIKDDVNTEVSKDCITTQNFSNYNGGYKEINVKDPFRECEFQVSITECRI